MKVKKVAESEYLIRLEKGDDISQKLCEFCQNEGIVSGIVSGIGALSKVEIGVYNTTNLVYDRKDFSGDLEVLSCTGNITILEENPFSHLHIMLADKNYNVFGGHLFSSEVL